MRDVHRHLLFVARASCNACVLTAILTCKAHSPPPLSGITNRATMMYCLTTNDVLPREDVLPSKHALDVLHSKIVTTSLTLSSCHAVRQSYVRVSE